MEYVVGHIMPFFLLHNFFFRFSFSIIFMLANSFVLLKIQYYVAFFVCVFLRLGFISICLRVTVFTLFFRCGHVHKEELLQYDYSIHSRNKQTKKKKEKSKEKWLNTFISNIWAHSTHNDVASMPSTKNITFYQIFFKCKN